MPITSPNADLQIPDVDLWTYYMNVEKEYPEDHTIFIQPETSDSYCFADLRRLSAAFGAGLKHQFGWKKGDVLAVFATNNIDLPSVYMGVHWAGGAMSPANPTYTTDELVRQLKDSGARVLVTIKPFLRASLEAARKAGMSEDSVLLMGRERDETGKYRHWKDVTDQGAWIKPRKTKVDPKKDLAYLVYSSGTTGMPKGVMLTHYNMVSQAVQLKKADMRFLDWERDSQIGVLPWFHIYGMAVVINITLLSGAKCVTMSKFNLEKFCNLIQTYGTTFIYVPPPIVLALGKSPLVSKFDLSTLRFINSAAAPLSKDLVDAVWNRLKIGVKQGYGLSETSPTVTKQTPDEWMRFQGSVGKLVPNMIAKIVDEEGKEVPRGQTGELLLKGPNVFGGYWNRPALDKDSFTDDGWYKTGDIFYADKFGNFYVTDRIKELIKYKGFQVPPAELEAKIIGRQDVDDVCVIGIFDDAEHTEIPQACIVLKQGVEATDALATEITEWFDKQVGPPKKLRGGVRFIKEIPKSASGKTLRRVLKEEMKQVNAGISPRAKL